MKTTQLRGMCGWRIKNRNKLSSEALWTNFHYEFLYFKCSKNAIGFIKCSSCENNAVKEFVYVPTFFCIKKLEIIFIGLNIPIINHYDFENAFTIKHQTSKQKFISKTNR